MFRNPQREDKINQVIRDRIRLVRTESGETQEDLTRILEKTRVTLSDIEWGRVSVSASALVFIAANYEKPIGYSYPPPINIGRDEFASLDEELISLAHQLPESQQ